ncbi:MAG: heavy metal-binding domain-containing protein [Flavobacterium sp.]|nr:heavy metal-binding domain-containing protein [Flavobacterium sp.]
MKKIVFSALVVAFVLISCNQKNKSDSTDRSHMMDNDTIMMNDKTQTMENHEKMYACPMHPEVQGKMNDKCAKCGMKLTELVPEKAEEGK